MSALLEVHTTFATEQDATSVARALISKGLAACAQVVPGITSIYVWQEMLRHESEVLLLLKTTEAAWPGLRDKLAELHPYDTPEIIALPIAHANYDYAAWLRDGCRG
jgi:periplasmic divalent cation tolerance protein